MSQYGNMTLREREDKSRVRKENQDSNDSKESKKNRALPRRTKYDAEGLDKETGLDVCDCLVDNCPGCWMNCPNCGSMKCGPECRQSRRYKYDVLEIEGDRVTARSLPEGRKHHKVEKLQDDLKD